MAPTRRRHQAVTHHRRRGTTSRKRCCRNPKALSPSLALRGSSVKFFILPLRSHNCGGCVAAESTMPITRCKSRVYTPPKKRNGLQRITRVATGFAIALAALDSNKWDVGVLGFSADQITPHLESCVSFKSSRISTTPSSFNSQHTQHSDLYRKSLLLTTTCLYVSPNSGEERDSNGSKKKRQKNSSDDNARNTTSTPTETELELLTRVTNLEQLVSKQEVELRRLRQECNSLTEAGAAFARIVELLREEGVSTQESDDETKENPPGDNNSGKKVLKSISEVKKENKVYEYFDDSEIFGTAPSSVIDAADSAGAAILAGLLGGKQRMLVDVRDAELSRDQDTLVQFIELAILPVAAGLEGLKSTRNRVKIVFPTVSQLLQYRRTMALAAPEVVALSTLGFDPVEKRDNLVVLVAPAPDDEDGLAAMNELLFPSDPMKTQMSQPTVVLNHHMVPVSGPASSFEVAYHLRLLSVQYMTGDNAPEYFSKWEEELKEKMKKNPVDDTNSSSTYTDTVYGPEEEDVSSDDDESSAGEKPSEEDAALEAAMKHAHELGVHQGVTRAMVIRAYPRPWHVFVDTSPDTDADFEVAATFDKEPTQDDVNFAIVECLEGSEREDELVAQQMQQALEDGQLDRVSDMLGISTAGFEVEEDSEHESLSKDDKEDDKDGDDDDDNYYNDFDFFGEDSC